MNKVFKVIWNHATQTWTAVSELGHAKGKTKSKKIVKLTALAGAVLGVVGTAQAAVELGSSSITIKSDNPAADHATKGINNINIGTGANTYRNEGLNAAGEPIVSHDAIAIGSSATGTGDKAVAIGKGASATKENGIAIGFNATNQSIDSVAIGREATSSKDMDVAIGKQAKATGGESLAFGSQSKASGQATIAVGKESNASGSSAVAAGYQSAAAGDNAVAVGKNTTAGASNAIAVGLRATATGTRAIATGAGSSATGEQSLANGFTAKASGNDSIALGNAANASAANATAIGTGAVASDNNAVALGAGSTTKGAIAYQSDTFFGKRYVFAGGSPSSVVSIGSDGKERQLVNVAAGRINGQSTDAVNGSQLYAVADAVSNHHWVIGGNTTAKNTDVAPVKLDYSDVKNADIVEFQNGKGTTATVENTPADKSSGRAAKTIVKYNANIVNGDNTEVVYNPDGSVKINAKVAGGTDTTAAVTTTTTDALSVTNTTTGNVTTYNVDAKTGSISTTPVGAATYAKDGDKATGGNYGSRLTNVSTVTDIVNNVSWHLNSSAVTGTNGKITEGSDTEAADVKASNTVNINAGKNIEIKRNGTTIEISSTAGEKGDTGATGAKGDTGAAGAKGDTGATGAAGAKGDTGDRGEDGSSITGEVVDNGDGTHTITITDLGTGSVTTTIVKDGKDGKDGATGATGADGKNAEADVKDNGDGTHTVTIKDGNGNTTTTIVKDGKNAEADVKDNGDGTHTVTIKDGNGNTTTAIIKDGATGAKGDTGATGADGKNAEADVKDNGDGTHTVTIKDGNGNTTTTIIKDGATGAKGDTGADGKNAEADVKDNGDGTHTVTIKDGNGNTTTTIIKDGATGAKGEKGDTGATGADGKNAEADVKDNGDGTHTVTIKDGNGNTTTTIVKDGATGAKGDKGDKGEDGTSITGEVVDNGDGTHTITITDLGTGSVTTTIVKDGKDGATGATGATGADGKNAEADVKDNGDGTHTVTIKDGNGNTTTTIVKDGKNGKDGVMTWDIKSTGNTTEGSADTAKTIKHTNTVDMAAGKNLTVNQTNNSDGAKVEFALNSTVTNLDKVVVNGKDGVDGKDGVTITAPVEAKDGKDGSDGKVGISGKDGKDAVSISGKDGVGQIGLTGPKGKDGKDGASINITTDNGKQTLVNREVGADGKPGETTQRIIYVPTDKDGNPLKDENGKTIKREVATMDDGLIFGGNTGEAHKAALGTQVNVKGADANTDWNKFDAGQNIMTKVDTATKTITVGLAKDLNVDNVDVKNNVTAKGTISAPTFKAGDTTINNGVVTNLTHHIDNPTTVVDDKVLNITDEKKKEAATVRDVLNSGWNLQANGKPVDAVTHGNNVNFASDKGTVTVKANSDGKTSVVNLDVNVDNDTITVNNKGQLVANGATNFNVATKDGGNKVAKKGGSSTAKITSGKTITYTAGKNIAIEQNGGEILVSTTNDVDHNSVTTNDLTVNKGGNIDMGGNQIHNVKAGTKDTDAVNVSQLKQSIGDVHKRINKVGKEARGGIAGANAAAGLPQVYIPGKSMVAASAGTFKGESAVAVGYSRSSDNGKVIFKLQGNANTQGDVGGSVGVGYQW